MTGIFINGNSKQRITNDEFDMMVELISLTDDKRTETDFER